MAVDFSLPLVLIEGILPDFEIRHLIFLGHAVVDGTPVVHYGTEAGWDGEVMEFNAEMVETGYGVWRGYNVADLSEEAE